MDAWTVVEEPIAFANANYQLPVVLDTVQKSGCNKIIRTRSAFENDEGAGSLPTA